jgi:hypothetical protein
MRWNLLSPEDIYSIIVWDMYWKNVDRRNSLVIRDMVASGQNISKSHNIQPLIYNFYPSYNMWYD